MGLAGTVSKSWPRCPSTSIPGSRSPWRAERLSMRMRAGASGAAIAAVADLPWYGVARWWQWWWRWRQRVWHNILDAESELWGTDGWGSSVSAGTTWVLLLLVQQKNLDLMSRRRWRRWLIRRQRWRRLTNRERGSSDNKDGWFSKTTKSIYSN